jgi:hypothetical protein
MRLVKFLFVICAWLFAGFAGLWLLAGVATTTETTDATEISEHEQPTKRFSMRSSQVAGTKATFLGENSLTKEQEEEKRIRGVKLAGDELFIDRSKNGEQPKQRHRRLGGGDYEFDNLQSAEAGAVACLVLLVLLLVLICCCCCGGRGRRGGRGGFSMCDCLALVCIWEMCCGGGGFGDDFSDSFAAF